MTRVASRIRRGTITILVSAWVTTLVTLLPAHGATAAPDPADPALGSFELVTETYGGSAWIVPRHCPTVAAQLTYAWFVDGAAVPGATAPSYSFGGVTRDRVRVEMTEHRDGHAVRTLAFGAGLPTSGAVVPTADVPSPTPTLRAPAIAGTPRAGGPVDVQGAAAPVRVAWGGPPYGQGCTIYAPGPVRLSSRWTGAPLTVQSARTDPHSFNGLLEISAPSAPVVLGPPVVALTPPQVGGSVVGRSLSLTLPQGLESPVIRWRRGGAVVPEQGAPAYTLSRSDWGALLAPTVTITTWQGRVDIPTVPASWRVPGPVAGVAVGPLSARTGWSGLTPIGTLLSPQVSGWCEAGGTSTSRRQWLRDGRPIPGATGATYRLGLDDSRHRISLRVDSTVTGCPTASETSQGIVAGPDVPQLWARRGGFLAWQGGSAVSYGPGGKPCPEITTTNLDGCWPTPWGATAAAFARPGLVAPAGNADHADSFTHHQFWALDQDGTLWWSQGGPDRRVVRRGLRGVARLVGLDDLGSDGITDLMTIGTDGSSWYYRGDGRGGLLAPVRNGGGWQSMTAVTGVGDFDRDGRQDVMARRRDGSLWLYPSDGVGGFLPSRMVGGGFQVMDLVQGVGDWDGDRRVDLGAREARTGRTWVYRGDGRGGWLPRIAVRAIPGTAR